jgi:hypothetical protein
MIPLVTTRKKMILDIRDGDTLVCRKQGKQHGSSRPRAEQSLEEDEIP